MCVLCCLFFSGRVCDVDGSRRVGAGLRASGASGETVQTFCEQAGAAGEAQVWAKHLIVPFRGERNSCPHYSD